MHKPFELPRLRTLARHAFPSVLEASIIPLVLFYSALAAVGVWGALLTSLGWCYAAITWRVIRRRPIPGLLGLGALGLTARTIIAFASGSTFVYFLQPTLTTVAVGGAFLLSIPAGRPLAQKLATDFFPLPVDLLAHGAIRRVFVRITVLWAMVNLVNAVVTMWLLVTQPLTTYLLAKTAVGYAVMIMGIAISTMWFRRGLRSVNVATVPA